MVQHRPPNIRGFFHVIWYDWGARMSGIFTVPFTLATIVFTGYARGIFGAMAIAAFLATAYQIWADERRLLVSLEQHLAPRLRIEFDPRSPKFVSPAVTANGIHMIYVRVLARSLSPIVRDCRAYLTGISFWNGERYVPLFDEQVPIPWSYEHPSVIAPRVLNHEVDALLDVAWFAEPDRELPSFGLLNVESSLPGALVPALLDQTLHHPEQNLKLDILVTGTDSESATLSLNIHRGQPQWDRPQIGWMDGLAIRRDNNVV
jgi:hypothetical protein